MDRVGKEWLWRRINLNELNGRDSLIPREEEDQEIISTCSFRTLLSRKVEKIKKNINQGMLHDLRLKS